MPTTRPSDKNQDKAQWWKQETEEQIDSEAPSGSTSTNKAEAGKKKFDQEMEPVKHPT